MEFWRVVGTWWQNTRVRPLVACYRILSHERLSTGENGAGSQPGVETSGIKMTYPPLVHIPPNVDELKPATFPMPRFMGRTVR